MNRAESAVAIVVLAGLALIGCLSQRGGRPGTESLTYTREGRLASHTTPNGNTIKYQYDLAGRLTLIKRSFFSSVSFQYNAASDLVSVRAPSGTTELKRDPFGRITKIVSAIGRELGYEFDPWGRVSTLWASNGYQIKYSRNLLGQLTSVDDGHGRTTYAYSQRTVVRQLPNGVRSTFTFLPSGRVSSIAHQREDGGVIVSFDYEYRPDGKVKTVREVTAKGQNTESYEYDLLGRVTSVENSDGDHIAYTYDSVGNRKTETSKGRTTTFEYDLLGQLVRSGAITYRYDNSGNLVVRRDGETRKSTEYEYDMDNRLVTVRGAKKIRYTYDGLGNRIKREAGGETSFYLNDPSTGLPQTFVVFDKVGQATAQYLLADSRLGERDGAGKTLYYLGDRMGTIRFVLNERGQIEKECKYSAFGQPLSSEHDGQSRVCGYGGESWDEDAGLLYLRQRYYDPTIGRFISADPFRGDLSNPRSLNRYVYASNDPINRRDPSGLQDGDGGGFSFDAPVIDTGSSYSWSSSPQSFIDNWNPSQVQVQNSDSGPSVIDSVKSALSNAFGFGSSATNSQSSPTAPAMSANEALQPGGNAALSGLDLAALKFGGDLTQAISAKAGLASSVLSLANSGGDPIKIQDAGTGLIGYAAGLGSEAAGGTFSGLGLVQNAAEAGLLASGVPQQQVDAIKYSADRAAFNTVLPGASGLLNSMGDFVSSGTAQQVIGSASRSAFGAFGLDNSDIMMPPTGGQQGPVGGVRLDKAAELIGSLGSISGAYYDPKSGRVVVVGDKNVALPPMRLNDLAVALRAAYSGNPSEPSMTIDPDPRDPKGPTMDVIFFGGTANTHFGWVMFEADRVMKTYSVGRDNLTKVPVQSQINGYYNIVQLGEANGSRNYKPQFWSRFWLVPETIKLRVSSDGKAIVFDETKIRVCTETMRWVGGKLVSANPPHGKKDSSGSPCIATSGEKDESAEYFAKHFSDNYNEFAKESPIYGELKRLAQVYALAKWMKKSGIQIDPQWADRLAEQPYETPRTTPSISNSVSRTWRNSSVTHSETHSVFGGTDLGAVVAFRARDARANAFAAAVSKVSLATGGQIPPELSIDGRLQRIVTLPMAAQPDYGSFRTSSADMLVASTSGTHLQLLRSYTSYHTGTTSFGRSWSLLLPHLHFVSASAVGESRAISVEGVPGTTVFLKQFHVTDDFSTLDRRFTEPFVDQQWKRIGFQSKQLSLQCRGLYPNPDKSYSLMFSNGDEWRFDPAGKLVTARSGATVVDYRYEAGTETLKEINSGGAKIQLEYDGSNRIVRARSNFGADVRYSYDGDGNLTEVESSAGKIGYVYDNDHQLVGQTVNGRRLWSNEYDSQGRFMRQRDPANKVLQEQKIEETTDGGRRIVQTRAGVVTTSTYDSRLRPLEARWGNNVLTYTYYPSGAFKKLQGISNDNARVEVDASEDRREIRVIDLRGTTRDLRYDDQGRLLQVAVNGSVYVKFIRDPAGRPSAIDYGTFREHYRYDSSGRAIQYAVDSGASTLSTEQISITYNVDGRITNIATNGYGSICITRGAGQEFTLQAGDRTIRTALESDGRIAETIGPDQQAIAYRYGADRLIEKLAYRSGDQEGYALFNGGRLQELQDLLGGRTHYEYNEGGRLAAVSDAYGAKTQYFYDNGGRLAEVVTPDGRRVAYAYDGRRLTLQIREQ